jgi:hypothetical protein
MSNGNGGAASDVATKALGSLPFGSIIGGPLVAAVKAQAQAARSTVEFIEAVGFKLVDTTVPKKDEDGNDIAGEFEQERKINTVTFKYKSGNEEVELEVPILTIVPIPFIRIDDMTIQFKANISAEATQSTQTTQTDDVNAKASVSVDYWAVTADFEASYSSKKDSTSSANSKYAVEYTMDVYVHAVQDDMPAGLNKVLNLLTDSISSLRSTTPGTPGTPTTPGT